MVTSHMGLISRQAERVRDRGKSQSLVLARAAGGLPSILGGTTWEGLGLGEGQEFRA